MLKHKKQFFHAPKNKTIKCVLIPAKCSHLKCDNPNHATHNKCQTKLPRKIHSIPQDLLIGAFFTSVQSCLLRGGD